jgi:hypothetical protein
MPSEREAPWNWAAAVSGPNMFKRKRDRPTIFHITNFLKVGLGTPIMVSRER